MAKLLIAGCGALGNGLGQQLPASAWTVYGLRRNCAALAPGIVPLAADLSDVDRIPPLPDVDALIYTATPSTRREDAYRQAYVNGLQHVLSRLPRPPQRLIYVSSTSVLADTAGGWVDEQTTVVPPTPTARILHHGEQAAYAYGDDAECTVTVIRFAGIYGEQRRWLIRKAREAELRCVIDPPQWTNRIHEYDCVTALRHVLELPSPAALYHGVDDQPAPRHDVLTWLREQLGLPPPQTDPAEPGAQATGKRVSNGLLRDSGWRPAYPDYRAGYSEMLAAET